MSKITVPTLWAVPRKHNSKKTPLTSIQRQDVSNNGVARSGPSSVSKKIDSQSPDGVMLAIQVAEMKGDRSLRPNLNDKRNAERVIKVFDWCIRQSGQNRISHKTLDKVFGHGQNPTSMWLRAMLLIPLRGHCKMKKKAKEWKVNTTRLCSLMSEFYNKEINMEEEVIASWTALAEKYGRGPFEYTEPVVGGRRYHELQLMPNIYKKKIWAGFLEYDLSAANVTLITQLAKAINPNLRTHRLDSYLANKHGFRTVMANMFNITVPEAKQLVQCVISLAYFGANQNSHAFSVLSKDGFDQLVNHPYFTEMRTEISECWRTLLPKTWADGEERFRLYEQIEREILDACAISLKDKSYLLQHDGFLLFEKEPLDLPRMMSNVEAITGYEVKFDLEVL